MAVEINVDIDELDTALRRLGYHPVDEDQHGRSYLHDWKQSLTAEVDEQDCGVSPKLLLRYGDLDGIDISGAENYLKKLYTALESYICRQERNVDWLYIYASGPDCEYSTYLLPDEHGEQV